MEITTENIKKEILKAKINLSKMEEKCERDLQKAKETLWWLETSSLYSDIRIKAGVLGL